MRLLRVWKIQIALVLSVAAATARADVLKIVVDDTIHPIVVERVDRAIQEARRIHADALLIELRTPGGLMSSMEQIIHKVLDAPLPRSRKCFCPSRPPDRHIDLPALTTDPRGFRWPEP